MSRRTSESILPIYFAFFAISIMLLIGERINTVSFLRQPVEFVLNSPRSTLISLRVLVKNNFYLLFSKDAKEKIFQSEELKNQIDILKSKIRNLEEENQSMRKQLEAPLPPQWDMLGARVLGRDRYLIIDKGERDGVSRDMVVIIGNMVVGKVYSTTSKTSKVIFLWDPESKISVKTDRNTKGLLVGVFGNEIRLTRVLQKDPLNELDLILTSGEEGGFPPDLIIGKLDKVEAKAEDIYKEGKILPLVNYDDLERVFVITAY